MDSIYIVYIDDDPDENISKFLVQKSKQDEHLKYDEVRFKHEYGYESLINNPLIRRANIVFIDSKLFENESVASGKFTGEEFKMILKKMLPFIEVFVITQNDDSEGFGTIQKYRSAFAPTPQEYYQQKLHSVIDDSINNINIYRKIANKLKNNDGIEKILIEKIIGSLDGISQYDELTTKDIDEMIMIFRELQREIHGQ